MFHLLPTLRVKGGDNDYAFLGCYITEQIGLKININLVLLM